MQRGEKPPVFGDLLLEAWRAYKSPHKSGGADNSTSHVKFGTDRPGQVIQYDSLGPLPAALTDPNSQTQAVKLTPGEWQWVIRLLNILRSGTVAARGIKWNVMMVSKAMGLWDDAKADLLPTPTEDSTIAAQREIEIAERLIAESEALIAESEAARGADPTARKRDLGDEGEFGDASVEDIAAFLKSSPSTDREIVTLMIQTWKQKQELAHPQSHAQEPAHAPKKETRHPKRKAV